MNKKTRIKNLEKQYRECSDETSPYFKKHLMEICTIAKSIVCDKDCPEWIKQDYFMRKDFFDGISEHVLEELRRQLNSHRLKVDTFWVNPSALEELTKTLKKDNT